MQSNLLRLGCIFHFCLLLIQHVFPKKVTARQIGVQLSGWGKHITSDKKH